MFCGGGTAGHVNPALAIASTILEKHPDTAVRFVASAQKGDKARELVPRAGYDLSTVHIRGMRRPLWSPSNVKTVYLMARSRGEAKKLIREFCPDLIVGTGGFACWPLLSMGADMGIPTAVHESNALPGLAVSRLKNKVDKILINFPETEKKLSADNSESRVIRVGNPHMPGFVTGDTSRSRAEARRALGLGDGDIYILSFGGSLGSEVLNDAVITMADSLISKYPNVILHHGTGKRDHERSLEIFKNTEAASSNRVKLLDYIYDMPTRMSAADIVISRAGAMSVSELALLGRAAVLVPSPYVADDHQYKNAKALEDVGAGICVEEKTFSDGALEKRVSELVLSKSKREIMGRTLQERFACPDANEKIYDELMKLINKK